MLVRVPDKRIVKIENLKRHAYERQGWCKVAEGRVGKSKYRCSCNNPCGFRAFPGANRIRDLMWSDILKSWRRALRAQGTIPNGPESVEVWETMILELKKQNRRMRDAGLVTKSTPVMLLARLPGPIVRGLAHDYPHEFSPTLGAKSADINKHLEAVLDHLYINFEYGRSIGSCIPKGVDAVIL